MATFLPSTNPASFRPCRKGSTIYAKPAAGVLLRNPTTGIAACCARAATGHAVAAPPSSVMNWRRLRSSMGSSPEPAVPAYRSLRMYRKRPQVLGLDRNRPESRRRRAWGSGPSKLRKRPPASRSNPHADDFDPAPADDHAVDGRRREPSVDQLDQQLGLEPVGQHDRLGAAVDGCLKQFEGSTALLLSGRHLSLGDVGSAYEIAT